jgi:hypothetical protein
MFSFIFRNDISTSELYSTTVIQYSILSRILKAEMELYGFYGIHPVVCCAINKIRILPEFLGCILGYILQKCIDIKNRIKL